MIIYIKIIKGPQTNLVKRLQDTHLIDHCLVTFVSELELELNSIVVTKWWIYFVVFHWTVWNSCLGVLLIHCCFLYKSVKLKVDLIRPFFIHKLGLRHSRNFVGGYLVAILILNSYYNAAVSICFLGFQVPNTVQEPLK